MRRTSATVANHRSRLLTPSRSASLTQANIVLRDQLEQAQLSSQKLTDDLRRLNAELLQVREDLTQKKRDWKEEERVR